MKKIIVIEPKNENIFLLNTYKLMSDTRNIKGIKNIMCLISLQIATLKIINIIKIVATVISEEKINILFKLFSTSFFSMIGKIINPTIITIGNLKNNQMK